MSNMVNVSEEFLPDGWETTGEFRPPEEDEYFLCFHMRSAMKQEDNFDKSCPQIILRRKVPEYLTVLNVKEDSDESVMALYVDNNLILDFPYSDGESMNVMENFLYHFRGRDRIKLESRIGVGIPEHVHL